LSCSRENVRRIKNRYKYYLAVNSKLWGILINKHGPSEKAMKEYPNINSKEVLRKK